MAGSFRSLPSYFAKIVAHLCELQTIRSKAKAKELSTISRFASKKLIERNRNIMKDYGNGYSIEELATKYRLSVRTCYRALDDAKQKARIQLAQVEDARKAEILAAYKNSVPLVNNPA